MNTLEVIAARRSIRRYKRDPVPEELLQQILLAGTQAPSGKNLQPWRFVVVRGEPRATMARVMREGIEKARANGIDLGSSIKSASIMEQAPMTLFVFDPGSSPPGQGQDEMRNKLDAVNIQSIGAAIENMLLAAQELGLGSLWICDIYYAYDELKAWLGEEGQMIAAVCIGYADANPAAQPRKPVSEVTRFVE